MTGGETMDPDLARATPDLRTRRRLETRSQIAEIATDLFLAQGVAGTTVEQIAAASGISPRTFFRYFATKEDAALVGLDVFIAAIDQLHFESSDVAQALLEIERTYREMLDGARQKDFVAITRLLSQEPALRKAFSSRNQSAIDALVRKLEAQLPDDDRLSARVVVEVAAATLNAALEHWSSLDPAGGRPLDIYTECCRVLRRVASPSTP
jgi:AcrR family transcriptional regulator